MSRREVIRSNRLRLRRARPSDLNAIHRIMSDPETMHFWSTPAHATLAETERWFTSMLKADATKESDEFVIEHRGDLIGKVGVWRVPELGFFLRRDCWGRGFTTEALRRYVRYAKERRYNELTADVDPRNSACMRVLAKCGFAEIGRATATYVVDGLATDSIYLHLKLDTPA